MYNPKYAWIGSGASCYHDAFRSFNYNYYSTQNQSRIQSNACPEQELYWVRDLPKTFMSPRSIVLIVFQIASQIKV